MTLSPPGVATSACEVTSVGRFGFWLIIDDREYFVPFVDYPAFRDATMIHIYDLARIAPDQLYWPALDIDIDLNALDRPEAFPLLFR